MTEDRLFEKGTKITQDLVHIVGVCREEDLNQEYIKTNYTTSALSLDVLERCMRVMKALTYREHYELMDTPTKQFEILLPTNKLAPILFRQLGENNVFCIAPRGPKEQQWHGIKDDSS